MAASYWRFTRGLSSCLLVSRLRCGTVSTLYTQRRINEAPCLLNAPILSRRFSNLEYPPLPGEKGVETKIKRSMLERFVDWFTEEPVEEDHMSEEERAKREELLKRLQEMFLSKPPVRPDLSFCKECIETLIKYDDRIGVRMLWNSMSELGLKPDEELTELVEAYYEKVRRSFLFDQQ